MKRELLKYLVDNALEFAALAISYFSLIVPIQQYLGQRKLEEKDKRFNNYHKLIKELVAPDGALMIDRQIAVIFELRNYPEYYELSERILKDVSEQFEDNTKAKRLLKEINLTITFIKGKK